jgi:hypothetical protein
MVSLAAKILLFNSFISPDMKGQTRYVFPADDYFTVDPTGILIQSSNVTVQNGTIFGFWNGVVANAIVAGLPAIYLTGIDLEGITFSQTDSDGTWLNCVNNSIVKNCTYIQNYAGVLDSQLDDRQHLHQRQGSGQ